MSEEKQSKPDMTPGLVSWNELMTPSAEGSKEFYGKVFGWTSQDMDIGDYTYTTFHLADGRPVAGMMQISPEMGECPPYWGSYVTVENADDALAKAKEHGAKEIKEVTTIPMGRFAVIQDPQGAVISLWEFGEPDC